MRFNISLEDAHNILTRASVPVEGETLLISDALGRILSQDITAPVNLPLFDKSAMDGYALQSCDILKASYKNPVILSIIDETRAGFIPKKEVVSGTAVKIMTGTAIPNGADVVIRSEDVLLCADGIKICKAFHAGANLVMAGVDIQVGELIAQKGTVVWPPLIGLLAGLGIVQVPVYKKITVAVMSTGDELIHPSESAIPGKIFNSSLYGIMAQCCSAGASPLGLGIVPDDAKAVAQKMSAGLEQADIVITTGGTSNGDYDVVEEAMMLVGAKILFNGVAIKSGSPIFAGEKNGKFIIALSGNPSGAMATFDLVVRVLLNKLMGYPRPLPCRIEVVMAQGYLRRSPVRRILHAKLFSQAGVDYAELTDHHSRRMVESVMESNFFIDIPAGSGYINSGELVWGFFAGNLNQTYFQTAEQISAEVNHQDQYHQNFDFPCTA